MAQLALESITKRYGDLVAMNDFTLTVRDHEFLVLLGPSGAGKTTTLRTVAGLEKPDQGQVRIGETVVTRMSPAERNVAFVFQFYALYPFMTARENMAFPLKANPMPKQEIERRVGEVAKTLQIGHLLARKPGQLSGGEQQRVALGRAMVRRPQAFLMDEPLTNLDAKLRTTMRAELKHLQRDLGATTLYVTHDQVEALTMGDRVAVLKSGMLQQVGTPREIYDRPTNTFVAAFVGHPLIALLPCVVQDGALALEGSRCPYPALRGAGPGGGAGYRSQGHPGSAFRGCADAHRGAARRDTRRRLRRGAAGRSHDLRPADPDCPFGPRPRSGGRAGRRRLRGAARQQGRRAAPRAHRSGLPAPTGGTGLGYLQP